MKNNKTKNQSATHDLSISDYVDVGKSDVLQFREWLVSLVGVEVNEVWSDARNGAEAFQGFVHIYRLEKKRTEYPVWL